MKILSNDIKVTNWAVLYLGLKKQWLTPRDILVLCERKLICNCSDDDYIALYIALEESLYVFTEKIKQLVTQYEGLVIDHNENQRDAEIYLSYIPEKFWFFWEIEFLTRIINSDKTKVEVLEEVAGLHSVFNYPIKWHPFIFFMTPSDACPAGEDVLYSRVQTYISEGLETLKCECIK